MKIKIKSWCVQGFLAEKVERSERVLGVETIDGRASEVEMKWNWYGTARCLSGLNTQHKGQSTQHRMPSPSSSLFKSILNNSLNHNINVTSICCQYAYWSFTTPNKQLPAQYSLPHCMVIPSPCSLHQHQQQNHQYHHYPPRNHGHRQHYQSSSSWILRGEDTLP